MTWELLCVTGEAAPAAVVLSDEAGLAIDIGRDPNCDVRLFDDLSSRFHARLEKGADGFQLIDQRSRNGTWLGTQRVETVTVGDGSTFRCGDATFTLVDRERRAGETRIASDGGLPLRVGATTQTRTWSEGDDTRELAALHNLCRRLAAAGAGAPRASLVAEVAGALLGCERAAVVRGAAILGGSMPKRLARRLAGGQEARLLVLGRELLGQTIADEAVGSAVSAPLQSDTGAGGTWLVAARSVDREALGQRQLTLLARLAAEVAPFLIAPPVGQPEGLIGDSPVMEDLRRRLLRSADSDATVLITGPSGSGKEVVARAIHRASGRREGPFVAVNCAAVASGLFEAELFGHEKGAFTGADQARSGRVRAADGGTLFLDEVGELPLEMQAKLLRVLQEGEVDPVGGGGPVAVDCRVVAATNRDLRGAIADGSFREDLFYRLDVLRLHTPALAEHRADIPALAEHLLSRSAADLNLPRAVLDDDAAERLSTAPWPGNVRQLDNVLRRALVQCRQGRITADDLDIEDDETGQEAVVPAGDGAFPTLAQVEAEHVRQALARCEWNKSAAARLLGISRPTILRKIADYGLRPD